MSGQARRLADPPQVGQLVEAPRPGRRQEGRIGLQLAAGELDAGPRLPLLALDVAPTRALVRQAAMSRSCGSRTGRPCSPSSLLQACDGRVDKPRPAANDETAHPVRPLDRARDGHLALNRDARRKSQRGIQQHDATLGRWSASPGLAPRSSGPARPGSLRCRRRRPASTGPRTGPGSVRPTRYSGSPRRPRPRQPFLPAGDLKYSRPTWIMARTSMVHGPRPSGTRAPPCDRYCACPMTHDVGGVIHRPAQLGELGGGRPLPGHGGVGRERRDHQTPHRVEDADHRRTSHRRCRYRRPRTA